MELHCCLGIWALQARSESEKYLYLKWFEIMSIFGHDVPIDWYVLLRKILSFGNYYMLGCLNTPSLNYMSTESVSMRGNIKVYNLVMSSYFEVFSFKITMSNKIIDNVNIAL